MRSAKLPHALIRRCGLALLCLCAATVCVGQQTQSSTPSLRVLVTDAQQRALPGAVCALLAADDAAKAAATATTDEQGVAVFPAALTPASYTLRVESAGFETFN